MPGRAFLVGLVVILLTVTGGAAGVAGAGGALTAPPRTPTGSGRAAVPRCWENGRGYEVTCDCKTWPSSFHKDIVAVVFLVAGAAMKPALTECSAYPPTFV